MITVDTFLKRVRIFDYDRLQIERGQSMHERALDSTDMMIDEIESLIAGLPYLEATPFEIEISNGVRFTPLPDGVLRIDNAVMLRDDGRFYYNLDPVTDPVLEPWIGNHRGRPVGYFVEGEDVYWDPPNPLGDFTARFSGYVAVPDIPREDDGSVGKDTLFPLHPAYVNPVAALVSRMFEHARGEDLGNIQALASELVAPVIDMRKRRLRSPAAGRFKFVNF